ncbi:hypothetical protein GCM10011583_18400 [Streptomyces camponoticapitis]|uniref:YqaJ viral recombinase domain-containing protein n=1 Tax=Streptomyces camponoticapitis TaxID=1616125 RepID=A0ABQ2E3Y2_9ACTN|nr:hypothetical protein [Streptomyces camponoticapitis]GGJ87177.1 hypothetical protein GCM10011583_18400 [Streptomyces camponoticapitis]
MSIQNISNGMSIGQIIGDYMEQRLARQNHIPGQAGALGGDMTIEALPTWYAGVTFRSALEAGWAATLDSLNIAWQYEPEAINLPSGSVYLPDFRLPDHGMWLEVKGTGVPRIEKAVELGKTLACRCEGDCTCDWPGGQLVLIGHPPKPYDLLRDSRYDDYLDWERPRPRGRKTCPVWSSAHGRPAWLTRCPSCNRGGWFTGPWCRACRRRLIGAHAYPAGAAEIEFITISGPPVTPKPIGEDTGQPCECPRCQITA